METPFIETPENTPIKMISGVAKLQEDKNAEEAVKWVVTEVQGD